MKIISKKNIYATIFLFVIIVISFLLLFILSTDDSRLSHESIAKLREEYPICGVTTPPTIEMKKITLEETIDLADSFVYGEVIGDISRYNKNISTGIKELDDKRKTNAMDNNYEFFEYTISVISDSENIYNKGDKITISANSLLEDYNPTLHDGMKIVVPISKDPQVDTRCFYVVSGMYYITQDNYALSAYEEDKLSKMDLTGLKVDVLLQKLKK